MNAIQLISALKEQGIVLFVDGNELRFRAPKGALTADLKTQIAKHREEIVRHLQAQAEYSKPQPNKCLRCNTGEWIDESPRNGSIRTHCGRCGSFIGYRPSGNGHDRGRLA